MSSSTENLNNKNILEAVNKRRNFAIISHPDAGKTTLTEKLLLYGGAIQQAGAVKARGNQRKATSDWMELEKQRGISITSTVLQFEYERSVINLLDTPGHKDFSEDTYRTLAAADNAVMLEDAAKGLEPQTRKLFEVCRMRKIPIFTFINKMDRPGREPFSLLDEIESELGLNTLPVNWPIGIGEEFRGVIDRFTREVILFDKAVRGKQSNEKRMSLDDKELSKYVEKELLEISLEELEVLDEAGSKLEKEEIFNGSLTPVFFGSAMTNFGVRPFLDSFLKMAQKPASRNSNKGDIEPASSSTSSSSREISSNSFSTYFESSLSSKLILFSFDCFPLTALSNRMTSLVNLSTTPLNSSPIPIGQFTGKVFKPSSDSISSSKEKGSLPGLSILLIKVNIGIFLILHTSNNFLV